jgi:hypothetical protein
MKKNIALLLQFLLIFLAGCTPIIENHFASTGSPIPKVTRMVTKVTPTEKQTQSPSPFPTFPKPTAIATPIVKEIIQSYDDIPICASHGNPIPLPSHVSLSGTIIFQQGYYQGLYSLDGKTRKIVPVDPDSNQQFFVFGYSPDGEWLAYSPDFDTKDVEKPPVVARIKLISQNGQVIETSLDLSVFNGELQYGTQLVGFSMDSHWINDRMIYATLYAAQPHGAGPIYTYPTIIDPFSGTWENSLLNALPQRYSTYGFDLSADLHYSISTSENGILLTDLVHDSILWKEGDGPTPNLMFRWLPNRDSGVIARINDPFNETKMFLVSEKGEETRITLSGDPDISLTFLSVSDDGRYVSVTAHSPEKELFLYDIVQQKFILRCPFVGHLGIPIPVWSPESHYIAYLDPGSPVRVLDIQTGSLYEIAQDFIVVDWK